jgi:hypothetical protein
MGRGSKGRVLLGAGEFLQCGAVCIRGGCRAAFVHDGASSRTLLPPLHDLPPVRVRVVAGGIQRKGGWIRGGCRERMAYNSAWSRTPPPPRPLHRPASNGVRVVAGCSSCDEVWAVWGWGQRTTRYGP